MIMRKFLRTAVHLAASLATLASSAPAQRTLPSAPPAGATYVVIVNAANPITTIERDELSSIFLKRAARWPDGTRADPIDLPAAEPSRASFSKAVHKKPVGAVRAFWQQQIFSGRDVPPAEKDNEGDVLAYVQEHVAAVGYVSPTAELPAGVKIIVVTGARL
jgi:ABC-type phosphate transport system substrate-binding protein